MSQEGRADQDNYEWPEDDPGVRQMGCPRCGPVRPCQFLEGEWICKPCYQEMQE